MISERLQMLLTANGSQAIAEFQKTGAAAQKSLATADASSARLSSSLIKVGAGMAAIGAVGLIGLYKAAEAAEEEGLAVEKLNNSISQSPELAGASSDAFLDQAAALQDVTRFADDATISSQALLGMFHLTQQEIIGLIPRIQDLAAKKGLDLATATQTVGKAMEGNIGILRRQGVEVDAAAFATDRYAAVTDALSAAAGGFAEREGARFSGRVQILKNNIGDLAEGVGVGAADAFDTMLSPVMAVSDGLNEISPGAQAAAGQILTFSAAGLVAAGSASMLAGGIINAVQRAKELRTLMAASSFAGAGPVFVGIAGAVALGAAAMAVFGSSAVKTVGDVEALNIAVGEQNGLIGENSREWLANTLLTGGDDLGQFASRMTEVGLTVGDLNRALANPEAMDGFVDRMEQGTSAADAAAQAGRAGATAITSANMNVRDVLAGLGASFEEVDQRQATHNDLLGEGAVSAEELADAYDQLNAEIDEYLTKIQGVEEAAANEAEAQQGLYEALSENGHSFDVNTAAGRENIAARNEWVDAVAAQIEAAGRQGEITGKTGRAQGQMNAAIRTGIGDLRRMRDAGLITGAQFDTMRGQIERIPHRVDIPVTSNVQDVLTRFEQLPAAIQAAAVSADAAQANAAQATRSLGPGPESGGRSAERAPARLSRRRQRPQAVIVVGSIG